jgi:hypothetical protein
MATWKVGRYMQQHMLLCNTRCSEWHSSLSKFVGLLENGFVACCYNTTLQSLILNYTSSHPRSLKSNMQHKTEEMRVLGLRVSSSNGKLESYSYSGLFIVCWWWAKIRGDGGKGVRLKQKKRDDRFCWTICMLSPLNNHGCYCVVW